MSKASELQSRGVRLFERGKYDEALEHFEQAVAAFTEEGDAAMAAEMRVNIGLTYREQGKQEEAVEVMQESLAYFKESGDQMREAKTLGNMALIYAKIDEYDQAETMYREAAILFKELGEDQLYGETILALGDMQFRQGDFMGAVATFEMGLERIKNPNQRQKMLKQMLIMKNRVLGQQKAAEIEASGEEDTPKSDRRRRRKKK